MIRVQLTIDPILLAWASDVLPLPVGHLKIWLVRGMHDGHWWRFA